MATRAFPPSSPSSPSRPRLRRFPRFPRFPCFPRFSCSPGAPSTARFPSPARIGRTEPVRHADRGPGRPGGHRALRAALLAAALLTAGATAPGAAADSGPGRQGVRVTPLSPHPGQDVELLVHGCADEAATARSAGFVAGARLAPAAEADGLFGEARVAATAEPGAYPIAVACDGDEAKVSGRLVVAADAPEDHGQARVAGPAPAAGGAAEPGEPATGTDPTRAGAGLGEEPVEPGGGSRERAGERAGEGAGERAGESRQDRPLPPDTGARDGGGETGRPDTRPRPEEPAPRPTGPVHAGGGGTAHEARGEADTAFPGAPPAALAWLSGAALCGALLAARRRRAREG